MDRLSNIDEATTENVEQLWEELAEQIMKCVEEPCGRSTGKKKTGLESWWWNDETYSAILYITKISIIFIEVDPTIHQHSNCRAVLITGDVIARRVTKSPGGMKLRVRHSLRFQIPSKGNISSVFKRISLYIVVNQTCSKGSSDIMYR